MSAEEVLSASPYVFDLTKLEPGDILLSRIPMNLHDTTTWDSHLIQSLTRSRFSFAALHLGNGYCIEAVGSGIARLPLSKASVRDADNVRVLRLSKGYEWVGRRAAAVGQRYLQRGFCREGLPQTKCSAFHDVRRAAVVNSNLIVSAYLAADFVLLDTASTQEIFPGDILQSSLLEDITASILQRSSIALQPTFNLDDDTLSKRVHHWEVMTQLKVLCSYEVRRILDVQAQKPSSMSEMEQAIAERRWSPLDLAVCRSLQWYRYAEVYQLKQRQFFGEMALPESALTRVLPTTLSEERLALALIAIAADAHMLAAEQQHWLQQRDYYEALLDRYNGKSFAYMLDLYNKQIAAGEQLLQLNLQRKQLYQSEAKSRGLRLKIA